MLCATIGLSSESLQNRFTSLLIKYILTVIKYKISYSYYLCQDFWITQAQHCSMYLMTLIPDPLTRMIMLRDDHAQENLSCSGTRQIFFGSFKNNHRMIKNCILFSNFSVSLEDMIFYVTLVWGTWSLLVNILCILLHFSTFFALCLFGLSGRVG